LALLRQIAETPDRPLASVQIEAIAAPRWEQVTLDPFAPARRTTRPPRRRAERRTPTTALRITGKKSERA
jgi:hypothetical protein